LKYAYCTEEEEPANFEPASQSSSRARASSSLDSPPGNDGITADSSFAQGGEAPPATTDTERCVVRRQGVGPFRPDGVLGTGSTGEVIAGWYVGIWKEVWVAGGLGCQHACFPVGADTPDVVEAVGKESYVDLVLALQYRFGLSAYIAGSITSLSLPSLHPGVQGRWLT
jgi:hypothetical protein